MKEISHLVKKLYLIRNDLGKKVFLSNKKGVEILGLNLVWKASILFFDADTYLYSKWSCNQKNTRNMVL